MHAHTERQAESEIVIVTYIDIVRVNLIWAKNNFGSSNLGQSTRPGSITFGTFLIGPI